MLDFDKNNMLKQSTAHAQLNTTLALLKSFKLAEAMMLLNSMVALVAIVLSQNWQIKFLGLLVFCLGLGIFYFALRIRIDITLFEQWDTFDITKLDEALTQINSNFQSGRTLDDRLVSSHRLFKNGVIMLLLQSSLLVLLAYLF